MNRRKPGSSGADDPNQLNIDWKDSSATRHSSSTAAMLPESQGETELVQRLPWDFRESFPTPLPEAIDAGIITDEDAEPENIKAIHQEHGQQLLATLRDLDFIREARRRGFDPRTGKRPTSAIGMERLQQLFATEPERIERWWNNLIDTYVESFGQDAAEAFGKAIRARHAGIDVVAESQPLKGTIYAPETAEIPSQAESEQDEDIRETRKPCKPPRPTPHPRTVRANFPVPRPLSSAIEAGQFGRDENGVAIRPSPEEVRAITLQVSEKLIDLLETIEQAKHSCVPTNIPQLENAFRTRIEDYAADFGKPAAQQLEAFVRRQAYLRKHESGHSQSR